MWSLTPGIRHLNHGSFGAVPVEVQTAQSEWRSRWEANPTLFVVNELFESLARARSALALFLGASEDGLVFVRNASIGIAAVARSLAPRLEPGDEILVTNHEYNAVVQTLDFAARERGAVVRSVDVPFPLESPDQVTHPVLDSVTTKTRLVVVDHITSPTGLIFPIEEIVTELEPEVPVLVDGAPTGRDRCR